MQRDDHASDGHPSRAPRRDSDQAGRGRGRSSRGGRDAGQRVRIRPARPAPQQTRSLGSEGINRVPPGMVTLGVPRQRHEAAAPAPEASGATAARSPPTSWAAALVNGPEPTVPRPAREVAEVVKPPAEELAQLEGTQEAANESGSGSADVSAGQPGVASHMDMAAASQRAEQQLVEASPVISWAAAAGGKGLNASPPAKSSSPPAPAPPAAAQSSRLVLKQTHAPRAGDGLLPASVAEQVAEPTLPSAVPRPVPPSAHGFVFQRGDGVAIMHQSPPLVHHPIPHPSSVRAGTHDMPPPASAWGHPMGLGPPPGVWGGSPHPGVMMPQAPHPGMPPHPMHPGMAPHLVPPMLVTPLPPGAPPLPLHMMSMSLAPPLASVPMQHHVLQPLQRPQEAESTVPISSVGEQVAADSATSQLNQLDLKEQQPAVWQLDQPESSNKAADAGTAAVDEAGQDGSAGDAELCQTSSAIPDAPSEEALKERAAVDIKDAQLAPVPPPAPRGPVSWADRAKAPAAGAPHATSKARSPQHLVSQPLVPRQSGGGSRAAGIRGQPGRGRSADDQRRQQQEAGGQPRSKGEGARGSGRAALASAPQQTSPEAAPSTQHLSASNKSKAIAIAAGVPANGTVESAVPAEHHADAKAAVTSADSVASDSEALAASAVASAPGQSAVPVEAEESLALLRGDVAAWVPGPRGSRVQPRGLHNPGNLCFMNSVVQALMGGTSFCHLMHTLRSAGPTLHSTRTPTLAALSQLAAEFHRYDAAQEAPPAGPRAYASVLGGKAVAPASLTDLVHRFSPQRARGASLAQLEQEDAQEFLAFVLESLHQELLLLKGGEPSPPAAQQQEEEQDGWLTKSGKKAVKQQEVSSAPQEAETLVTALFQGKLATSVSCAGAPTSVTVHPFNIVGLAIGSSHIRSVVDALDAMTAAEMLPDYKPSNNAAPTMASKTERFQRLPHMLVLHLMRFEFNGRLSKVNKAVVFEPRMAMRAAWLAAGCKERGVEYELVATVSHHGKNITSGHYTADVLQPDGRWLRFDDGTVFSVSQQTVMSERTYLLFYQKTLNSKS